MRTYTIRILHLSDLHERVSLDWMSDERKAKISSGLWKRGRVLGASFYNILSQLRTKNIDIVCFAGDVADWGLKEEYQKSQKRIDKILRTVNVPYHRFFPVPGNHDIKRNVSKDEWEKIRELAVTNQSGLSKWMVGEDAPFGAEKSWRENVIQRSSDFWNWVSEDLKLKNLLPSNSRHNVLGYSNFIKIDGIPFPVHIIGLDSAWLSGDNNDAGKLMLTDNQVGMLTTDDEGHAYDGFRIALMHHPLSSLIDHQKCQRILSDNVDLVMHGHQHDPIAKEENEPSHQCRILAAGSLYEGDEEDSWMNSFQLVEVTLTEQGKPLQYDISFFSWSEKGHWYPSGAIYQDAPAGHLSWQTPLGKKLNEKIASDTKEDASGPRCRNKKSSEDLMADRDLTNWQNPKDKTILVKFPNCRFRMGSDLNQLKSMGFHSNPNTPDETLNHMVELDEFWFARNPITNKQYLQFCEETGCALPNRINDPIFGEPESPVIGVSWLDAEAYLKWAGLRFPTEAEWERVACGMSGRFFPWGNELPTREHANFAALIPGTTSVNKFPQGATPEGILDMAGNLMEWCLDDTREYQLVECKNPKGSLDDDMRAIKGGSLRRTANQLRSAYRERRHYESTWGSTGIRAALSLLPIKE